MEDKQVLEIFHNLKQVIKDTMKIKSKEKGIEFDEESFMAGCLVGLRLGVEIK